MQPNARCTAMVFLLGVGACDLRADREPPAQFADLVVNPAECRSNSVRPVTGAPAEGLWVWEDGSALHRVAAMVGPTQVAAGQAHLTRRVETLETRPGADTIRHQSDTASVRLELVPPLSRPAAVYRVGPFVLLASYEPCTPGLSQPLIRYLRLDTSGELATDVLLQREATR